MWRNLWNKFSPYLFPVAFLLAIGIRIYASLTFPAQAYDISTYGAWGSIMLDKGPSHFFESTWSDYLPLPIYFCSLITIIANYLNFDFGIVFKLAISTIELLLIMGIWRHLKPIRNWKLFPFLLFSPALLGDSAFWGQLDTIPALLAVMSLLIVARPTKSSLRINTLFLSALMFGLAVSIKPIILIILPVFIIVLLGYSQGISYFLSFGLISFATFLIPAVPIGGNPFIFLIEKALEQSSTYPYTTINAWNLWSIVPLHNTWPPDINSIFGISAHNAGLLLFLSFFAILLNSWRLAHWDRRFAFRLAGTLLVTFFVFTTRMHERHLFFGLPFLAVALLIEPWLLFPLTILTSVFTLNLYGAYYWVNNQQAWPFTIEFMTQISWCVVLTGLALVFVWNGKSFFQLLTAKFKRNKLLMAILLLAALLRFYNLSYPDTYIFDEVYHSFTAREFMANNKAAWEWWTTPPPGVAYEWTHPPVAKYGMVLGMLLFGQNSLGWRIGSAAMGVISILGIYYLTSFIFRNRRIGLLASSLVAIEGLHISQSRVGMNDMYMLCFLIWSVYQAVRGRWKSAAILYGLSLASKWSALYGVIPLAYIFVHQNLSELKKFKTFIRPVLYALRCLLITVCVYILAFIPFLTAGHTWAEWWELHRQMWYYHTHLVATHAYQSAPQQWIFSLRPVWYYVHYGDVTSNIYAQGNPLILWSGLAAILLLLPRILSYPYALSFLLYAIFTVPWIFSPRIMFFYHYLPSATFLTLILAAWLAEWSPRFRISFLILCIIVYVLISPMIHGFAMSPVYWDTLFTVFPSWK